MESVGLGLSMWKNGPTCRSCFCPSTRRTTVAFCKRNTHSETRASQRPNSPSRPIQAIQSHLTGASGPCRQAPDGCSYNPLPLARFTHLLLHDARNDASGGLPAVPIHHRELVPTVREERPTQPPRLGRHEPRPHPTGQLVQLLLRHMDKPQRAVGELCYPDPTRLKGRAKSHGRPKGPLPSTAHPPAVPRSIE